MVTSNPVLKKTLEITGLPYSIGKLVEAAGTAMFTDDKYISESRELIKTERNLVYSALSTHKSIKLYKPSANFILIKLLKGRSYCRRCGGALSSKWTLHKELCGYQRARQQVYKILFHESQAG